MPFDKKRLSNRGGERATVAFAPGVKSEEEVVRIEQI